MGKSESVTEAEKWTVDNAAEFVCDCSAREPCVSAPMHYVELLSAYEKVVILRLAEEAEQEAREHDRKAEETHNMSYTQDAIVSRQFAAWLREKAR